MGKTPVCPDLEVGGRLICLYWIEIEQSMLVLAPTVEALRLDNSISQELGFIIDILS